ncbi:MAG: hypothetical protein ABSA13_02925 [Beijerinckiaceae bacterium]|jgi:hypothetical protein
MQIRALPTRAKLEHAIETLITYLDVLDGDPGFEADLAGCATLPLPDLEIDVTDCEMNESDNEPLFGSLLYVLPVKGFAFVYFD